MTAISAQSLLKGFVLEKVLQEDPKIRFASLLGSFETKDGEKEAAILLIEKTHFSPTFYQNIGADGQEASLEHCSSLGSNDVYNWILAWMPSNAPSLEESGGKEQDAHVKLTLIRPATEAHIAKYSEQCKVMVTETPEMYRSIVLPWIESQPPERILWVYNILDKKKEVDTILYEHIGQHGFIILPDLKWDRKTLSSLYLVAIVHDRSLRTIRDLTREHIPLLRDIQAKGEKVSREKFGLKDSSGNGLGKLRCFLHYQPTYYNSSASHLHVHLLSSDYTSHPGSNIGQAHLLEDVIDLLELGIDFQQRTLTYSLGERSQLLKEIIRKT